MNEPQDNQVIWKSNDDGVRVRVSEHSYRQGSFTLNIEINVDGEENGWKTIATSSSLKVYYNDPGRLVRSKLKSYAGKAHRKAQEADEALTRLITERDFVQRQLAAL